MNTVELQELNASIIKCGNSYRIIIREKWSNIEFYSNSVESCIGKAFLYLAKSGKKLGEVVICG